MTTGRLILQLALASGLSIREVELLDESQTWALIDLLSRKS